MEGTDGVATQGRAPVPAIGARETIRPSAWVECTITGLQLTQAAQLQKAAAMAEITRQDVIAALNALGELARLTGVDVSGLVLRKLSLQGCDPRFADLRGADLRGANLSGAALARANLWEADLRGALLNKANSRGAQLHRANLTEADLSDANLGMADLTGAHAGGEQLHRRSCLLARQCRRAECIRTPDIAGRG